VETWHGPCCIPATPRTIMAYTLAIVAILFLLAGAVVGMVGVVVRAIELFAGIPPNESFWTRVLWLVFYVAATAAFLDLARTIAISILF
jgi:hypothetical protein